MPLSLLVGALTNFLGDSGTVVARGIDVICDDIDKLDVASLANPSEARIFVSQNVEFSDVSLDEAVGPSLMGIF